MTAGCDADNAAQAAYLKEIGLVPEHSYSIMKAMTIESNGEEIQICQMRNPWGKFEWSGDWGDESDLWTDELRELCDV